MCCSLQATSEDLLTALTDVVAPTALHTSTLLSTRVPTWVAWRASQPYTCLDAYAVLTQHVHAAGGSVEPLDSISER